MSLQIHELEALIGKPVHCSGRYVDHMEIFILTEVNRRSKGAKIQGLHADRGFWVDGDTIRPVETGIPT